MKRAKVPAFRERGLRADMKTYIRRGPKTVECQKLASPLPRDGGIQSRKPEIGNFFPHLNSTGPTLLTQPRAVSGGRLISVTPK
jgi:hypothetical protein